MLRRAMSRVRSEAAMLRLWEEFRDGARARGVDDPTIEAVFKKLMGFASFGFPKAHSAAFALLAYQSAWLRRRYPAEFLAALMNAQPMGFYPPASLVNDAARRGVRTLRPCVNRSDATCTIEDGAVRIGLGYVREVRTDAAARMVAERAADGPFRDLADLAGRTELRREQLAQLVRAGALDDLAPAVPGSDARRAMLWEVGVLPRSLPAGAPRRARALAKNGPAQRQLPLPIGAAPAPPLPPTTVWERTLSDYETMGLSAGWHLMALVRSGLPPGVLTAAELKQTPHGRRVCVAGVVVARQRPATANGIVFLLLEDETGMVNGIVRPEIYERYRSVVRAEPMLVAWGRLERRERVTNVLVDRLARIEPPKAPAEREQAVPLPRVRAAVPAGQQFGRGRR
jgi:error-prone DNA polymerase